MIVYHQDVVQGEEAWHALRCGKLTASEVKLILTPTLKQASNDKERAHLFELLAQRITQYVEPQYIGDDMLRGWEDEIQSRNLYSQKIAKVTECGFVTNDNHGFVLGYSPDGLVGDDGQLECKSRIQKHQVRTIASLILPEDYALQVHTGLIVTERKWCDFISYSAGLPMMVLRVYPDEKIRGAILEAAAAFEERLAAVHTAYMDALVSDKAKFIPTERPEHVGGAEMFIDDDGNYS